MRVALFVTCLLDLMRPSVGFAAIKLLETAGCTVVLPESQACCGQPAFNSGDRAAATALARKVIAEVDDSECFEYVVTPSASCADQIRNEYPKLFADDAHWCSRAELLSGRIFAITDFLANVLKVQAVPGEFSGSATYHDSCTGLRSLGIKAHARAAGHGARVDAA